MESIEKYDPYRMTVWITGSIKWAKLRQLLYIRSSIGSGILVGNRTISYAIVWLDVVTVELVSYIHLLKRSFNTA